MADITPPLPAERQLIQSYGGGGFRIAGVDYAGSVLVEAELTRAWSVSDASSIDVVSLEPLTARTLSIPTGNALILVGTGSSIVPVSAALRVELRKHGFSVEIMDTGAACRTFNVLLAEERAVAAALIAVD